LATFPEVGKEPGQERGEGCSITDVNSVYAFSCRSEACRRETFLVDKLAYAFNYVIEILRKGDGGAVETLYRFADRLSKPKFPSPSIKPASQAISISLRSSVIKIYKCVDYIFTLSHHHISFTESKEVNSFTFYKKRDITLLSLCLLSLCRQSEQVNKYEDIDDSTAVEFLFSRDFLEKGLGAYERLLLGLTF
jgi:hypothetical protein